VKISQQPVREILQLAIPPVHRPHEAANRSIHHRLVRVVRLLTMEPLVPLQEHVLQHLRLLQAAAVPEAVVLPDRILLLLLVPAAAVAHLLPVVTAVVLLPVLLPLLRQAVVIHREVVVEAVLPVAEDIHPAEAVAAEVVVVPHPAVAVVEGKTN